jgi:hypothetical protein
MRFTTLSSHEKLYSLAALTLLALMARPASGQG